MNKQREMFESHFCYFDLRVEADFEDDVMYADDLTQGAWFGWKAAIAAQQAKPIKLQHLAVCDEGVLRWMSGITPRDCELYAMPDGGNAPKVVYIIPTDVTEKPNEH